MVINIEILYKWWSHCWLYRATAAVLFSKDSSIKTLSLFSVVRQWNGLQKGQHSRADRFFSSGMVSWSRSWFEQTLAHNLCLHSLFLPRHDLFSHSVWITLLSVSWKPVWFPLCCHSAVAAWSRLHLKRFVSTSLFTLLIFCLSCSLSLTLFFSVSPSYRFSI